MSSVTPCGSRLRLYLSLMPSPGRFRVQNLLQYATNITTLPSDTSQHFAFYKNVGVIISNTSPIPGVIIGAGYKDVAHRVPGQAPDHRVMSIINTANLAVLPASTTHRRA